MIIDPPAVMYGPPEAIEAWLAELATYPQDSHEVQAEIQRAQEWLKDIERLIADDAMARERFAGLTTAPRGGANNPKGSNQHQKVVNADNVSIDQDLCSRD